MGVPLSVPCELRTLLTYGTAEKETRDSPSSRRASVTQHGRCRCRVILGAFAQWTWLSSEHAPVMDVHTSAGGGRRAQLTTYLPALLSALAQLGKLLVEIQNHLQFWPMKRIIRDAAIAAREAVKDLDTSMHILRDDFADDPSAGSCAPV